MSTPVVVAQHLGLVGPAGPVFAAVDAEVHPGALTVVVGPSGSGRSALLLALTGRMRDLTGSLRVGRSGRDARARGDARGLRRRSAVARLAQLVAPEGQLDVQQSLEERALIDGVRLPDAERAFTAAESLLETDFDRSALVEQLSAYDRSTLALALALLRPADVVVLDDVDAGLDGTDQRRLMAACRRLADAGPAVLVSTTERTAVPVGSVVVPLVPRAVVPRAPHAPAQEAH